MAKYTVELRDIVNSGLNIFDFGADKYPVQNESLRAVIEKRVINHYYLYEIGAETVGRFKHLLKTRMNEIMPTYNMLFAKIESGVEIYSTHKSTLYDKIVSELTGNDNSLNLNADMPQGGLNITDGKNVSNIGKHTGSTQNKNESIHNGTVTSYDNITEVELLKKFKDNMIDVINCIIYDLHDLFMLIY